MSASRLWDNLTELFAGGAVFVDFLSSALFWICLIIAPIYLFALFVRILNRLSDDTTETGQAMSCFSPGSLQERLDLMASVAISRRPQTRKRRHRHRHAH